jgi:hypothetical protein
VGWVLTAVVVLLFIHVGGFGYRAYVIHVGAMFGTIMAFNVVPIWPARRSSRPSRRGRRRPRTGRARGPAVPPQHLSIPLSGHDRYAHGRSLRDSWIYLS